MNISIEKLNVMRSDLEKQYNNLDMKINSLYAEKKEDVAVDKIKAQDLIDKQLALLDTIIRNLENTPKLYSELMDINEKYKQVVGDYNE